MNLKPLCFILMPFGKKADAKGRIIDFDSIYASYIKVAVEKAGLEPIRADEELTGGTIHKPMFERLILCEYAIADLTSLNPNVFYELGLRHAIRGQTTIPIFAFDAEIPFDLTMERTLPYRLDDKGELLEIEETVNRLVTKLAFCKKNKHIDSPVFQLIEGFEVLHNVSHDKTDVFREQAVYDNDIKDRLLKARNISKESLVSIWEELKPINEKSAGVVIDLFMSLRAVEAYPEMVKLNEEMDMPLRQTKLVREQLGFALNRDGRGDKAEKVLHKLIEEIGFDPETNGILGRIYKDRFLELKEKKPSLALAYLNKSIESYKNGFDADWRDPYPGVNLVTLAELAGEKQIVQEYLPIVKFAANRRMSSPKTYWDFATLAELSVIENDISTASAQLSKAITYIPDDEAWMMKSTLNNLKMIRDAKSKRGKSVQSLVEMVDLFDKLNFNA